MPRIPDFDQNQLASSVVGTPQVDNSGARLLGSIASGLGSLGGQAALAAGQIFRQEQAQLDAQAKAQAKFAEKQRRLTNAVVKANKLSEFKLGIAELENDVKTNELPSAASERFRQRSQELRNTAFADVTDLELRSSLLAESSNFLTSRTLQFDSDIRTIETRQAAAELDSNFDSFSLSGGLLDPTDGEVLSKAQKALQSFAFDNKEAAFAAYGANSGDKIRSTQIGFIKNFFAKTARENPELLEQMLDADVFAEYIPETMKGPFYNQNRRYLQQQKLINQKEQEYKAALSSAETSQQFTRDFYTGSLRYSDLDTRREEVDNLHDSGVLTDEQHLREREIIDHYEESLLKRDRRETEKASRTLKANIKKSERDAERARKQAEVTRLNTFADKAAGYRSELADKLGYGLSKKQQFASVVTKYRNGEIRPSDVLSMRDTLEALRTMAPTNGGVTNSQYGVMKQSLEGVLKLMARDDQIEPDEKTFIEERMNVEQDVIRAWASVNNRQPPAEVRSSQAATKRWVDWEQFSNFSQIAVRYNAKIDNAMRKAPRGVYPDRALLEKFARDSIQEVVNVLGMEGAQ